MNNRCLMYNSKGCVFLLYYDTHGIVVIDYQFY